MTIDSSTNVHRARVAVENNDHFDMFFPCNHMMLYQSLNSFRVTNTYCKILVYVVDDFSSTLNCYDAIMPILSEHTLLIISFVSPIRKVYILFHI